MLVSRLMFDFFFLAYATNHTTTTGTLQCSRALVHPILKMGCFYNSDWMGNAIYEAIKMIYVNLENLFIVSLSNGHKINRSSAPTWGKEERKKEKLCFLVTKTCLAVWKLPLFYDKSI